METLVLVADPGPWQHLSAEWSGFYPEFGSPHMKILNSQRISDFPALLIAAESFKDSHVC